MPVICRKCGGEHLTIKCGKQEEKNILNDKSDKSDKSTSYNKYDKYDKSNKSTSYNKYDKSTSYNKYDKSASNYNKSDKTDKYISNNKSDKSDKSIPNDKYIPNNKAIRRVNKPSYEKYSVLITNLPDDIQLINIQYMMMDWGKVGNINLKYSEDKGKMCYVDFYNKDHKDYFIKALDKTAVGFNIINISSIG